MANILIQDSRVIDGTGNPWFYADVLISDGRIDTIAPPGRLHTDIADEVVDAGGLVLCPGFIDIQSHSISVFMQDGRAVSKVTQGVTTEIMGELWTPAPFGGRRTQPMDWSDFPSDIDAEARTWTRFSQWMDYMSRRGISVNFGSFVGGATLREYACGWDDSDPSLDQVETMKRLARECMEDGAFGVASALIYPPNSYSPDWELTEVAKATAPFGGVYITHIRSEGDMLLEALEDAINLGREAGCPVEIYHLKATGKRNWHKAPAVIDRMNRARAEGIDITADMYPYTFSGTGLTVLLPDWASEGGLLWERLDDPATRARIRDEMVGPGVEALTFAGNPRRDYVIPLGFQKPENRQYIGRNLEEIAEMRGQTWADTALDLLASEKHRIGTVFEIISEENIGLQLVQPWIKISTDAAGIDPEGQENPTHPRTYGTYTRVLGKYVREEGVLSLEQAIRIMTSAVADRLGLRDRGQVRPGMWADLVLLDPDTVADRSTIADSHQVSVGIRDVWVNGERVLRDGKHTGALPGHPVCSPGRS